jgi:hypothetical protein
MVNTTNSTITSGTLFLYGGISILNTSDAMNISTGGSITTLGGITIQKSLLVGNLISTSNLLALTSTKSNSVIINAISASTIVGNIITSGSIQNSGIISSGTIVGTLYTGGSLGLSGATLGTAIISLQTVGTLTTTTEGSIIIYNTSNASNNSSGSFINYGASGLQDIYMTSINRKNTQNDFYNPIQFGAQFYTGNSLSSTGNTSTVYITAASFTTGNLENGQYFINLGANLNVSNNNLETGYRLSMNGNTTANALIVSNIIKLTSNTEIFPVYHNIPMMLTGGIYAFAVDHNLYKGKGRGTAYISDISFTVYRVNDLNTI